MDEYYIITENTLDIISLGVCSSLLAAEQIVKEEEDHFTHGERYIICSKEACKLLVNLFHYNKII